MSLRSIKITTGDEAIAILGSPKLARKKSTIQIREPKGNVEVVVTGSGPQEARSGQHFIAIGASSGEYPYDIEAFQKNMEEVPGKPGFYRKVTPSRLIEVPMSVVVHCVTIDQGEQRPLEIKYPDFIGIGAKNEVYPVRREIFDRDFEWI